jgi:hypothetical protein
MKSKNSKKPTHITARSITLNDANGKTRIRMDAGDGDGFASICLFGESGRSIQISSQPGGSMIIAIHGKRSQAVFGMSADEDTGIDLRDRQGLLGTIVGSVFSPGEHHLAIFRDGQISWSTRKRKKKRARRRKK